MPDLRNSTKPFLTLVALTVGARAVVIGLSLLLAKVDIAHYSQLHDGREYQQIASAIDSPKALRSLGGETQRLFPGYPAAIRLAALVAPMPWAAVGVNVLAAICAVLLFWRMTGDVWLAAYFAVFTPSWLLFSSTGMSEGLFLALALAGVALWLAGRSNGASFVLGLVTLVRPVGALVFAACFIAGLRKPNKGQAIWWAALFLFAPLVWMGMAWAIWGDPFRQLHAYAAKDLGMPFKTIVSSLFSSGTPALKKALVWFTLLTNLLAAGWLLRAFLEKRDESNLVWLLWCVFHGLFYLALPSAWAFGSLDRFFVTALPAMMVGLRPLLPNRWWCVAALAAAGVAICIRWNVHLIGVSGF
jgi:hypothetical protein